MDKLTQLLSSSPTILGDGAMGTMLQSLGLTTGGSPDEWNVTHPAVVKGVLQGYVDAGSQVVTTNTFGGTRFRLALHDNQERVRELNVAGARLGREVADAAPHPVLVAGDIGPTGEILFPLGTRTADEVREAFEAVSGRQLSRFFQRWIREFAIPTVRYSTRVEGGRLRVVFEQDAAAIHDLPVTVTLQYASGEREDVVVAVTEARTLATFPLKGPVRQVDVNEDNAALARFQRR